MGVGGLRSNCVDRFILIRENACADLESFHIGPIEIPCQSRYDLESFHTGPIDIPSLRNHDLELFQAIYANKVRIASVRPAASSRKIFT